MNGAERLDPEVNEPSLGRKNGAAEHQTGLASAPLFDMKRASRSAASRPETGRSRRKSSMSVTSKPRNVPGASGSFEARRFTSATITPASKRPWMASNSARAALRTAHDDDVVVGGVERIERKIELIGIEQIVRRVCACSRGNNLRVACGNARDHVFELRLSHQKLRKARARRHTQGFGDAMAVETPVDQHHVGAGVGERPCQLDRLGTGIDAVRLPRHERAEPTDIGRPHQELACERRHGIDRADRADRFSGRGCRRARCRR